MQVSFTPWGLGGLEKFQKRLSLRIVTPAQIVAKRVRLKEPDWVAVVTVQIFEEILCRVCGVLRAKFKWGIPYVDVMAVVGIDDGRIRGRHPGIRWDWDWEGDLRRGRWRKRGVAGYVDGMACNLRAGGYWKSSGEEHLNYFGFTRVAFYGKYRRLSLYLRYYASESLW